MRLDLRKLRFRQPKLVATHLCLLFGSRESRHYARANTFMGPDPRAWLKTKNPDFERRSLARLSLTLSLLFDPAPPGAVPSPDYSLQMRTRCGVPTRRN